LCSTQWDIHLKFYFHRCVLHNKMNKIRYHLHLFFTKIKLNYHYFKSSSSICRIWIDHVNFFYFFAQQNLCQFNWHRLIPFLLSGVTSPLANVVMPSCRVMLPFHRAKMRSLPLLHHLVTLRSTVSPLEPKQKYWICTSTVGHPPQTARLPLFTAIKM
jgi:hypothetical protein